MGTWSIALQYEAGDAVEVNGSTYVALVTPMSGAQPPNGQWTLVASAGAVGPPGIQGPQGDAGIQGVAGAAGPRGEVGLAGPQGSVGPRGDTGATGAQGLTGPAGPAGPAGARGLNWMGPWSDFIAYAADDVVEDDGSSYLALMATSVGSRPPNGQWALVAARGAAGLPGPSGPGGEAGIQGAQGAPGLQGPAGPPGPSGPSGQAGLSVLINPLAQGNAHCEHGGVELVGSNGTGYVCTGEPGPSGLAAGSLITTCGGITTNAAVDPVNCGYCGNACASRSCAGGSCAKLVFGTSQKWNGGSVGGMAGADAKCQAAASAAGLVGTFKAWLHQAGVSAPVRLNHPASPLVLLDGTMVAADWADFASPRQMLTAGMLDEYGNAIPNEPAYTFTNSATSAQFWIGGSTTYTYNYYSEIPDCGAWTSSGRTAWGGNWRGSPGCSSSAPFACAFGALNVSVLYCSATLHLLCFEQ